MPRYVAASVTDSQGRDAAVGERRSSFAEISRSAASSSRSSSSDLDSSLDERIDRQPKEGEATVTRERANARLLTG
ncbi:MAG: hypothetical protein K1X94_35285, partial [Sandaracinaceae bacterium]|nr:hypothetical protein [Sandaracinaceae bacterium]